jgi:hypothetical protein
VHAKAPQLSHRAAVLALVGLAVLFGAVTLGLLADAPAPAVPDAPWTVTGPLVVANLPVARCPTSYGIPATRHVHLPRFARAQVSPSLARSVSVFTDGLGTLDVLAPTGWGCTALDGVAGSSSLVVYPPGSPRPSWGDVTAVKAGVVASQTGSCGGCSLETACALFPAAAHDYEAIYKYPCRGVAARGELRTDQSATTVLFIDPPQVLGAGRPSGGANAAYGAMLWHLPHARHPAAWLHTCTLPVEDRVLCVLSVRAFLSRHPS